MKKFGLGLLAFGVMFSGVAFADYLKETYVARLSYQDHFNSRGMRLETAAGIIRQDRANFHRYHRRDSSDTWDRFFSNKHNRATMERFLERGYISPSARRSIVYGNPLIRVKIFGAGNHDYVKVNIISEGGRGSSIE
jgi:hypothetical protein